MCLFVINTLFYAKSIFVVAKLWQQHIALGFRTVETTHEPSFVVARLSKLLALGASHAADSHVDASVVGGHVAGTLSLWLY